jgi:DNA primase
MGKRQFTDQQLFHIRNHIHIRTVIENLLDIPSINEGNLFRFRCPLCAGYNTAVKTSTNLARCFPCGKNFNTIDIVMLARNLGFVETVELLVNYKNALSSGEKQSCEDNRPPAINQLPAEIKPCNQPYHIKDIITQWLNNNKPLKSDHKITSMQTFPSTEDIARLERLVESLSQQIEYLKETR